MTKKQLLQIFENMMSIQDMYIIRMMTKSQMLTYLANLQK